MIYSEAPSAFEFQTAVVHLPQRVGRMELHRRLGLYDLVSGPSHVALTARPEAKRPLRAYLTPRAPVFAPPFGVQREFDIPFLAFAGVV